MTTPDSAREQTIPASVLKPNAKVSKRVYETVLKHGQAKGWVAAPKKAWDPKDTPASVYDTKSLRGAGRELWYSQDFEMILHGGFETAKTYSCCMYINALLWKYPGAQWVMTRKTYSSLITTAVMTYKRVIGFDEPDCPIKSYGGEKPEWFEYPNGSRLWIAGFDNPQKVLSGERDGFYVNQVEEYSLDEWETITGRATGRGAIMPYTRVIGDCNPGPPSHWILSKPGLRLAKARHEDNPTLWHYAPDGVTEPTEEWPDTAYNGRVGRWTEQGRRSTSVLQSMTGIRYQRYWLGNWVAAEGVVYEGFDRSVHIVPSFKIPADWRRIRVIDFGFTNPFVCLWIAIDPDGRMYVYREIYLSEILVSEIARDIRNLSVDEKIEATICDHDAEDRATLKAEGIQSLPAWKSVKPGIDAVEQRLKVRADGKPRLMILSDAIDPSKAKLTYPRSMPDPLLVEKKKPYCTAQEFEFYVWAKDQVGKPNKEEPVKEFDHGLDAIRYAVCYVDNIAKVKNTVTRSSRRGRRACYA